MLRRYSIQWRSSHEGWRYFDRLFWTRRGAAACALRLVLDTDALCTVRVMKIVKGSDVEILFLHRTAKKPYCNCNANPGSRRARKHYPK